MISRLLLAGSLIVLLWSPAWGQEEGLWLDEASTVKFVEDQRDLQSLRSVVETQKAQLAAAQSQVKDLQDEIQALKDADAKRMVALAIADEREKLWQERQELTKWVIDVTKDNLASNRAMLEDARKRIEALEKRAFWQSILGPIGILAGVLVGGFVGF